MRSGFISAGTVILVLLCGLASLVRSAVSNDPFLGIPPQDEKYYKTSSSSATIKCRDGSGVFTLPQLNDDFCDCPDGTDEPGTSACPAAKFYCRNAGHIPLLIFSSRVNDGICDCCDGSDEYDGKVKCPNTCWEAGKVARDKLKKKIDTYKEGVSLRRKDVEKAKVAIAKDEAEISKLKHEVGILKPLVQQLKDRKEQIEKAEEKERLQKEKEERERKEAEEKENMERSEAEDKSKQETDLFENRSDGDDAPIESTYHDKIGALDDSPPDQGMAEKFTDVGAEAESSDSSKTDGSPASGHEGKQHLALDEGESVSQKNKDEAAVTSEAGHDTENTLPTDQTTKQEDDASASTDELSREELGRLVASRWTGNSVKQTEDIVDTKDNEHEEHEEHEDVSQYADDDEGGGYASETDDDSGKYDDVDAEDSIDESYEEHVHNDESSSYKHESDDDDMYLSDTTSPDNLSWLEKIQRSVRNLIQAVSFFQTPVNTSEAAHVRKEYEESNAKLSKIQSRISSLKHKLEHDFGAEKEFFSFYDSCFESKQNKYVYKVCPFKQASQLEGHAKTSLGRFEKFEDSYRSMIFSGGDRCWNGPDRSLKVKLRCGLKNELTDVDEPSRCEYVALLSTPALCVEEKLKELEDKLNMMNKEQPERHDEL